MNFKNVNVIQIHVHVHVKLSVLQVSTRRFRDT